jgi:hypothetical protein
MFLKKLSVCVFICSSLFGMTACAGGNHSPEINYCKDIWEDRFAEIGWGGSLSYEDATYEDLGYGKGRITLSAYLSSEDTELWHGTCSVDGAKVEQGDEY